MVCTFLIANTQLINGVVTGRITKVLNLMDESFFKLIGKINSREVHKKSCEWVGRLRNKNKRGFRSLANALNAGYDNCAYCLGDSHR